MSPVSNLVIRSTIYIVILTIISKALVAFAHWSEPDYVFTDLLMVLYAGFSITFDEIEKLKNVNN